MNLKYKYLINSFYFQKQIFEKYLSEYFDFVFTPPFYKKPLRGMFYFLLNSLNIKWLYLSGEIRNYNIVHFNRPEALLFFKKIPNQLSIFEVHGFDIGILGENYLRDIKSSYKKILGLFFDKIFEKIFKRKIKLIDIFYCSTPDLVQPLEKWCGRKLIWLPNPIDTELFKIEEPIIKLEGEPACFLPSRLHGDKKPEIAMDIFQNYIKPKYKYATLHLLEVGELVNKYKKELCDQKTYFWHKYMDKRTLAAKIRGADLVFGDFSIGALSLLPLQVMALKKPIVTLDKYEIIKKEIEELPELALKLLEDEIYRKEFIERNYKYVIEKHSEKAVISEHLNNLKIYGKIEI